MQNYTDAVTPVEDETRAQAKWGRCDAVLLLRLTHGGLRHLQRYETLTQEAKGEAVSQRSTSPLVSSHVRLHIAPLIAIFHAIQRLRAV
jgi:hypothetical protein